MLGIIVAVDYETNKIIENAKKQIYHNQVFYELNQNVVLTFSGIGKVNAASSCMNLINHYDIDKILNIGTSGSCNKFIKPLDVILVNNCLYGDVDVTIDESYEINQMPREPKYFATDESFNVLIKQILQELNITFMQGNAITVDSFVTKDNLKKFNELDNPTNLAIDMESVAIAQVCEHNKVSFGCVKFISDVLNSNNNHEQFLENVKIISNWIDNFLLKIITHGATRWIKN